MKNIRIFRISLLLATALTVGSCEKALDTEPFDKISEDVVWSTKANAETFIFSTYGIMNNLAGGPSTDARTTNLLAFDGEYNGPATVFNERVDRNADYGFNNWGAIRRCNMIITKVAKSPGISEEDKKALIAEGKFLRAMSYYSVARNIGRIVWIDRVLGPDDDMMLPSTGSPAESYEHIIKDLEDAVKDLPATKDRGRANKYTAAAMLSEVCLQALAYQNYPQAPNIDASNPLLEKAIQYANLVINEGGYTLESDYGSMFNDINPNSSEIIFAIYRKAINTASHNTPMQNMVPNMSNDQIKRGNGSPLLNSQIRIFEAWVQHGPTQNLAQDYLVIDKANPNLALPWDQTSQYKEAVDEMASIPTSLIPQANGEASVQSGVIKPGSSETVWTLTNMGRDARWSASILSDSSAQFYGETLTMGVQGNASRWLKMNGYAYYQSLSNMYWRKGIYNNVSPRIYVGIPTDYHYVITRLGRVYLNLAEAYLLKGDLTNALAAFNQTRTVHGKLPASTAITIAEAWEDYKRERRVDLTLENDYYWSLLRWGRYGGAANHGNAPGGTIPELTEVPRVIDISKNRKAYSIVEGSFFGANNVRIFDPSRRYLMPIAQSYLDRNAAFGPQNPGW
ncbi:RagB/SusD family nutrient uptake outer membrane protein [Pontibacter chinhatensis]|uniref:Starch-binding associating with outer membrane n=1 Tax=Pontibacter chinhatensis TaxID=1436961 RepID=A0A1I2VFI0_9BACT|nr:RagB/SusD family nutrient uptake outer membrane protein [Pontibacter chinhatensis]SFG87189.1 Starch-binding associating with outer membrane [Pontibacter chinhatensis]